MTTNKHLHRITARLGRLVQELPPKGQLRTELVSFSRVLPDWALELANDVYLGPCHAHLMEGQAVPAQLRAADGTPLCTECAKESINA